MQTENNYLSKKLEFTELKYTNLAILVGEHLANLKE